MKRPGILFFVILLIPIWRTSCFAQTRFVVTPAFIQKAAHGTTSIAFGYTPVQQLELYVAPAYSIFYGGMDLFAGTRLFFRTDKKAGFHLDLSYRRSAAWNLTYENKATDSLESYHLPASNWLVGGLAFDWKPNPESENQERFFFTLNYSVPLREYAYEKTGGSYSESAQESMRKRLHASLGFALGFSIRF